MKFTKTPLLGFLIVFLAAPFASGATLTIGAGSNTPASSAEPPGASGIAVLQLSMAASNSGYHIEVTRLTLTAQGTLNDVTGVTSADLYVDANANGSLDAGTDLYLASSTYSSDDGPATFSGFSRTVVSGGSEKWLVVYGLSASAAAGATFKTGVASNTHVTARYRSG
jgi:hypothetical protein